MAAVTAAFDFDGTLTRRDSLMPFLLSQAGLGRFLVGLVAQGPGLVTFKAGLVPNQTAKERVLAQFLGGVPRGRLETDGLAFATGRLNGLLDPTMMERLRWHQREGHGCVLVSASLGIYLRPWGLAMGFDAVLCSELAYDDHDRVTGRLAGANVYGPEKVRRLDEYLPDRNQRLVYAYGDSKGDHDMLAWADRAYLKGTAAGFPS